MLTCPSAGQIGLTLGVPCAAGVTLVAIVSPVLGLYELCVGLITPRWATTPATLAFSAGIAAAQGFTGAATPSGPQIGFTFATSATVVPLSPAIFTAIGILPHINVFRPAALAAPKAALKDL